MHKEDLFYSHAGQSFKGYLTYKNDGKPKPAVLIVHDWSGLNHFAKEKADWLASLGYLSFAVDMYSEGRMGKTLEEKKSLISPLLENRKLIRERMRVALATVAKLPQVAKDKIAAIGFCFGGLCVLDLARSGANISGVVSFHGLLSKPELPSKEILAKILVLHGYDDPMVKPEELSNFCNELTEAKVDWQAHLYGLTQHAFTNPEAHDSDLGTIYNPVVAKRAFIAMQNFLTEIFA